MTVLQLAPARQDRDDHPHHDQGSPEPIVALQQRVQAFDLSQRERERDEEHAFQAVLHADAVLTGAFPDTLDTVVQAMSWTGNPPVPDRQLMASAVTYLGSADGQRGWWLHYTRREEGVGEDGDLAHVLTLIAPLLLRHLPGRGTGRRRPPDRPAGRTRHPPGAPVDCDYRLRIRASSYADPTHSSIEPPF
ncbi:hypothetical protein ACFYO2_39405 [Streptomyces sp. NPDC006602]|uniref:hypothetical protein n=1 Tax=Streptomyces sp. NPDC006602 TaxID=3364751 RepID=UPI00367C0D01